MNRATKSLLGAAVALVLAVSAGADNKFDYCLLCHGANANGNAGIRAPKLSGMEPWYLTRQLENFAAGVRGTPGGDDSGHEMGPVGWRVKHENVLGDAVSFIGGLPSAKPVATVTGDVKHGKQLYAACAACHGAKGQGNEQLNSPALAARSDWYLVTQLKNFRAGLRGADERDTYGAQMRAVVATLADDKAVADVVAYINTL
ncbi:MAG TPA: c-type cytochrome [Steroidobacteraceae bacterium]|nr:c-type cytochrome [Steroidobacteraceae bacterium]